MQSEAYIFDLDDTLYCEHHYVCSGFKKVANLLHQLNPELPLETIYSSLIKEWETNGRGKVFNAVCEHFGFQVEISELVKVYREHRPDIQLYEDAKIILSACKRKNIPLGIITDGDKQVQWKKIEALKLKKLVNCIIVSDDLGPECWKPNPLPYLKAIECLGVNPVYSVYIGDNPHKDFVTARKLGMKTVRIQRETGDHMRTTLTCEYEADRNINSLEELFDIEW